MSKKIDISKMGGIAPYLSMLASQVLCIEPSYIDMYMESALTSGVMHNNFPNAPVQGETRYKPQNVGMSTPLPVLSKNGTAVIQLNGGIVQHHEDGLCGAQASYEGLLTTLVTLEADTNVTRIVTRIKSAGGVSSGMFSAVKQIRELSEKSDKEYIALIDGHAFSAGYAIASAFPDVWITSGSAYGSVGAYKLFMNKSEAMKQQGVAVKFITSGKFKVEGNPYQPISEEYEAQQQEYVEAIGTAFKQMVSANRNVALADVVNTEALCYDTDTDNGSSFFYDKIIPAYSSIFEETVMPTQPTTPVSQKVVEQATAPVTQEVVAQTTTPVTQEVVAQATAPVTPGVVAQATAPVTQGVVAQTTITPNNVAVSQPSAEHMQEVVTACNAVGITDYETVTKLQAMPMGDVRTELLSLVSNNMKTHQTDDPNTNSTVSDKLASAKAYSAKVWESVSWD